MESSYADLIIPIDKKVVVSWGKMRALLQSSGIKIDIVDGLLATNCKVYDLSLVTRNEKDFTHTGINMLDPWQKDYGGKGSRG